MAQASIKSMKEGGILWFSDLTATDPHYMLPLVSAISSALYVHFCPPATMGVKVEGIQKYFKFIVPVIALPFMIFFKSVSTLFFNYNF